MLEKDIKNKLFCEKYKGDELTKKVAEILKLDSNSGWSVVDTFENLAMVHYNEDANMNLVGHLRGVIVDLEKELIITDSFGYTPTIVSDKIEFKNGHLNMIDKEGNGYIFKEDNVHINKLYEGVVIRVIWYNNKCFFLTHKKINSHRSRWGSSKYFLDMYKEANGPTAEQLFDTSKPYSNTCYFFLVVDKALLVGTRQQVERPFISILLKKKLNINRDDSECSDGIGSFNISDNMGGINNESCILKPENLTVEEANAHLSYGYYKKFDVKDKRQLTGESLIVYTMENGNIKNMVKVNSTSYEWRVNMRGNNPNITHQFYSLLNSVYADLKIDNSYVKQSFGKMGVLPKESQGLFGISEGNIKLKQKLVLYPLYDLLSMKNYYKSNNGIINLQVINEKYASYITRDERIHLLWINYVVSLPIHLQEQGLDIINNFHIDKVSVVEWLACLEIKHANTQINSQNLPIRAKNIILTSRKLANDRIAKGQNYSANGNLIKLPILIKSTIRNLINKENGTSLYTIIKQMRKFYNEKQQQPTEQQPTEQQPTEQPTEQQTTEQQPIEQQPIEQQPTEQQPIEQQPTEQQPTEQH
jgi:hypothetical protein